MSIYHCAKCGTESEEHTRVTTSGGFTSEELAFEKQRLSTFDIKQFLLSQDTNC